MNEPGVCTLWVKDALDPDAHVEQSLAVASSEQETQIVILNVSTESLNMRLIFRRAEFSKMMAVPNDSEPIEVALNIEEEHP